MSPTTRRRFLRTLAVGGVGAGLVGAYTLGYEPRRLVAERLEFRLKRLPEAFDGFRIAQLTDIHFGPNIGAKHVARAVEMVNAFAPDVLLLTGDFVSHPFGKPNGPEGGRFAYPCGELLSAAKAPKLAVLGNHDHWNNSLVVEDGLKQHGIPVLRNASVPVERGSARLWMAGIGDAMMRVADLGRALQTVPADECVVLLAHEPDFADEAARYPVDLQLSGHSHGGQVRIPGVPLVLPPLARKYPIGVNQVGNLTVYTSRGVGMINPPVRFNCPPEVTLITLRSG